MTKSAIDVDNGQPVAEVSSDTPSDNYKEPFLSSFTATEDKMIMRKVDRRFLLLVYKSEHSDKYWKRLLTRECVEWASLVDVAGI